jgi:hypothetical protein
MFRAAPSRCMKLAQPFGGRQHPLAHRQAGENMVRQVCRRLHHASGVAGRADAPALAGIGDEVVVPAVIATQALARPWATMLRFRY